jgi:hypothetical protein
VLSGKWFAGNEIRGIGPRGNDNPGNRTIPKRITRLIQKFKRYKIFILILADIGFLVDSIRKGMYCFHTFLILEFLTIQVSSTLSLVLMNGNKIGTNRLVAVEIWNP